MRSHSDEFGLEVRKGTSAADLEAHLGELAGRRGSQLSELPIADRHADGVRERVSLIAPSPAADANPTLATRATSDLPPHEATNAA